MELFESSAPNVSSWHGPFGQVAPQFLDREKGLKALQDRADRLGPRTTRAITEALSRLEGEIQRQREEKSS